MQNKKTNLQVKKNNNFKVILFSMFGGLVLICIVGVCAYLIGRKLEREECFTGKETISQDEGEIECNDWINDLKVDYNNYTIAFYNRDCEKVVINFDNSANITFDYGYSFHNIAGLFIPFVRNKTLYVYDLQAEDEYKIHEITSEINPPEELVNGITLGFHISKLEQDSSGFIFHTKINISCGESCIEEGAKQYKNINDNDRQVFVFSELPKDRKNWNKAITSLNSFKGDVNLHSQKAISSPNKWNTFIIISGYDHNQEYKTKTIEVVLTRDSIGVLE
jgi:hypothetical protein